MSKGNSSSQSQPITGSVPLPAREAEPSAACADCANYGNHGGNSSGTPPWPVCRLGLTDAATCGRFVASDRPRASWMPSQIEQACKACGAAWTAHEILPCPECGFPAFPAKNTAPDGAPTRHASLPPADPLDHLSGEGSRESGE